MGINAEKTGERPVFQVLWKVHTGASLPNASSVIYWSYAPEEKYEEFENGNTKIVEGKHKTEEVEPLISLHVIAACNGPRTMRIKSTINQRTLVILIDSGSTHNFVDQLVA
jgi:hypothetical protein